MSKPRWADMNDEDPWPDPPDYQIEKSSYTPPHKRRPRVAEKKVAPSPEKEKASK